MPQLVISGGKLYRTGTNLVKTCPDQYCAYCRGDYTQSGDCTGATPADCTGSVSCAANAGVIEWHKAIKETSTTWACDTSILIGVVGSVLCAWTGVIQPSCSCVKMHPAPGYEACDNASDCTNPDKCNGEWHCEGGDRGHCAGGCPAMWCEKIRGPMSYADYITYNAPGLFPEGGPCTRGTYTPLHPPVAAVPKPTPQATQLEPPGLMTEIDTFRKALARWSAAGFKVADEETIRKREAICKSCEHWDDAARLGLGKCKICGCTRGKVWLATEKCTINKWPATA